MTYNAPSAAHRQESHAGRLSDSLTQVELTWYEKRIENWIRFGDYIEEKILDRRRRTLGFRSGTVFAFVGKSEKSPGRFTISSADGSQIEISAEEFNDMKILKRPSGLPPSNIRRTAPPPSRSTAQ